VGRWRFLFGRFELAAHFFLALEQRGHLQLQALDGPLLSDRMSFRASMVSS
jgi:hypothetical protein